MSAATARASLWAPPLAFMAVIFFFSAQPDLNSGLGIIDLIGRKIVHATEYGILCALWWRALRTVAPRRAGLLASIALTVAYAASDELHQTFVHGRHGSPLDVAIDAFGATVAALLLRRRLAAHAAAVSETGVSERAGTT